MKVKGIEIWAVRWPDKFSSSADDSSSEFLFQETLCHIGAVRWSFVLHPPEISSCCVRSKKWPNSILQEFEVAITSHGNFASLSSMNAWTNGIFPSTISTNIMTFWSFLSFDSMNSWGFSRDHLPSFFRCGFWCKTNSFSSVQMTLCTKSSSWARSHSQKLLSEQGCAYVLMEGIFSILL